MVDNTWVGEWGNNEVLVVEPGKDGIVCFTGRANLIIEMDT